MLFRYEDLADLVENRDPRALEARLERDDAGVEQVDFARSDYRTLIALREYYLADREGLKDRMPSVTQNRMRLARMTGTQAISAVTGPGGGLVNADVAAAIVRFVSGGGADLAHAEVEPSLLSLVCRELNNTRLTRGAAEISADLLAGSRDSILSEFYERALGDQPAAVRAFLEDELLTDSGYRESVAEERVRKGFAEAGAPEGALAVLVDRRLLRVEERLDLRRVEFTHDVLAPVIRRSRDERLEREAKAAMERVGRMAEATRKREGSAVGFAFAKLGLPPIGFSMCGTAAEITLDRATGRIKVTDLWCAADVGLPVQPSNIVAQLEGSLVWGLGSTIKERMSVRNGVVEQRNFNDYEIPRMSDMPRMHVEVIRSGEIPLPVGELSISGVMPAVANAFAALTGKKLRAAPFTPERVKAALA
mgnify:CR=1 FL=1